MRMAKQLQPPTEQSRCHRLKKRERSAKEMANDISIMSKEDLASYLEQEGLDWDVIETLRSNKISGSSFLELSLEDLKELFPIIGDRIAVKKLQEKVKGPTKADSIACSSKSMITPPSKATLSSSWLESFEIPTEFSHRTKGSIRTGVVTKGARCEIIAALATRILQSTRYPTPNEYKTICIKLIRKFPTLQDPVGNGYGTWRKQLRTRFRNSRRYDTKENIDPEDDGDQPTNDPENEVESTPPPAKKRKDEQFLEEEGDYENNKDLIRVEWDKPKPKLSTLKQLMDATYMRRREWIGHCCPSATEVLQTYPCMTNGKILRHEFRKMQDLKGSTDELTKDWSLWVKRVFAFSKLEAKSRGTLRDLLGQGETTKEGISKDDHEGVYFFYLLSTLLSGRKASNMKLLYQFQDSVNLESEIAKIDKGSPYLIMLTSEEGQQFFVVVERALLAESGNITTAVVNLIASYFAFDIVYPQPLYTILIFIQHYVLGVVDKQKVPNSATILLSSLTKITIM